MIEVNGQTSKQYPDSEQLVYVKGAGNVVVDGYYVHDGANEKGINCVGNWDSLTVSNCRISRIWRDMDKLAALCRAQPTRMRGLLGGRPPATDDEKKVAIDGWLYGSLHVDFLKITGLLPPAQTPASGTAIAIKNVILDASPIPAGKNANNALLGLIKDLNVASLTVDDVTIPNQAGSTYQIYNNAGRFIKSVTFQNGCTGAFSFQNAGGVDCDIHVNGCPGLEVQLWTPAPGGHAWGGRIFVDGVPIVGNLIPPKAPGGVVVPGPVPALPPLPSNIAGLLVFQSDGTITSRRNGNTGVIVLGMFDKPLAF